MISMKQRHRFFIAAVFLIIVVNVTYSNLFSGLNIAIVYMVEVLLFWAALSGYMIYSNTKYLNIINNECDPYKFFEKNQEIKTSYRANPKFQTVCLLNDCSAYLAMGKYSEALGVLNSIELYNLTPKNDIVYYLNKVECFLNLEMFDEFEETMKLINSVTNPYSPHIRLSIDIANNTLQYIKANADDENNIISHRDFFISALKRENLNLSKLQRLSIMYKIACLELKLGNNSEAYKYLKTIADEGNKLFIAEDARKKLEESDFQ